MEIFYQEIVLLSSKNIETKIALERQQEKDHIQKIKNGINNIFNLIINSKALKENITSIASKGYNKYVLYEFDIGDIEQGTNLPLIFFFKGPKIDTGEGQGLRFFKTISIKPLMYRLNTYFSPFKLFFNFNGKNKKYTLEIIW